MAQSGEACLGDLGVTWQEQQERMRDLQGYLATALAPGGVQHMRDSFVGHSPGATAGRCSTCSRRPRARCCTRTRPATGSGSSTAVHPDVAILAAAGRGNIDGEPIQGSLAEFVARQVAAVRPRRLLLSHHDDWLPGFSVPTEMEPLRAAIAAASPGTELLEPGYLAATDLFDLTVGSHPSTR